MKRLSNECLLISLCFPAWWQWLASCLGHVTNGWVMWLSNESCDLIVNQPAFHLFLWNGLVTTQQLQRCSFVPVCVLISTCISVTLYQCIRVSVYLYLYICLPVCQSSDVFDYTSISVQEAVYVSSHLTWYTCISVPTRLPVSVSTNVPH